MGGYTYRFEFSDGGTVSIAAPAASTQAAPAWTELGFHQCANCPLSADTHRHCPMALAFVPLVEAFGRRLSYEQVAVQVESAARTVSKSTSLQQAVGSVMGLVAASSGCPRMEFLAPMAHFHLPFSSEEETIYRAASTYLLAQYFAQRSGATPDWELDSLKASYRELQTVNAAMAARLRTASEHDGTLNALVLLDLLAKTLPYSIDDALVDVRAVFSRPAP